MWQLANEELIMRRAEHGPIRQQLPGKRRHRAEGLVPPEDVSYLLIFGSCFKSGDDDSYGFDLQGVISIYIHV